MQLLYTSRYYTKNFYKDIGLSPHFTIRGFFRRIKRKYPKTYHYTTLGVNLLFTTTCLVLFIPGTLLPFQKSVKLSMVHNLQNISYFFHMNNFNPNPTQYLCDLGQIVRYAMDHRVLDSQQLSEMLKNNLQVFDRKQIIITNRMRVQIIMNFVEVLLKLSEDQFSRDYLKSKNMIKNYNNLIDDVIMKIDKKQGIKDQIKNNFVLSLKIFEYSLKFADNPENKLQIINKLKTLVSTTNTDLKKQWGILGRKFANHDELKKLIKKIYIDNTHHSKLKNQINCLLKQVNEILKLSN